MKHYILRAVADSMRLPGIANLPSWVIGSAENRVARGAGDVRLIRSIPGRRRIGTAIDHIAPAIEPGLARIDVTVPHLSRRLNDITLAPPVTRDAVALLRRFVLTGRTSSRKVTDLLFPALDRVVFVGHGGI